MKRLLCLAMLMSAPAAAQDVGPALDPGAMVGWSGGEAVRQDNERRSGDAPPPRAMSEKEANARALCARKWSIRQKLGKKNPQTLRLFALCRQAGYY